MADSVTIPAPKECDICKVGGVNPPRQAKYDFKTKQGPWANGCEVHYYDHRAYSDLGTGKGQRLIVEA